MHIDHTHSTGCGSGRYHSFDRLNLAILLGTLSTYAVSRYLILPHVGACIWRSHGHDLLAMPVLLSTSNLYVVALRAPRFLIVRPSSTIVLSILAGIFWEFITPLYHHSTSDVSDFFAYALGATLYSAAIVFWQKPFRHSQ